MFGDPFQIRYLDNFFKLFDFVGKVLHTDISDGIPCLFVFFRPNGLDVKDTDKDKSINFILHEPFDKPSSENLFMDLSKSECNIVNETLSQNDSSDVPTNVITELKYDEHI